MSKGMKEIISIESGMVNDVIGNIGIKIYGIVMRLKITRSQEALIQKSIWI